MTYVIYVISAAKRNLKDVRETGFPVQYIRKNVCYYCLGIVADVSCGVDNALRLPIVDVLIN